MSPSTRRDFLQFLGGVSALTFVGPACQKLTSNVRTESIATPQPLMGMKPSSKDQLIMAPGFNYELLIQEGTPLGNGLLFGANNDFTQFVTRGPGQDAFLWVNHEYFSPYLTSGRHRSDIPTREQYLKERETVGGSVIRIKKNSEGKWIFVGPHKDNKRLSGSSKIPFTSPIDGAKFGIGSFANCSGGHTPWNTILTCEENYENFYGEWTPTPDGKGKIVQDRRSLNWHKVEAMDPRHYGWVVEFNPETGESKKLLGLGRMAHECAKVVISKNGKCVVYTGDDRDDECIYKFIATKPNSLEQGELFVADIKQQKWISLDITKQPILQKNFRDQTEVLIRSREAAKLLGGTPLARPEDIEQDPLTGDIFIALTNNRLKGDLHGSILKISEKNNEHSSLEFKSETYMAGGADSGFSCPDNMAFDQKGNLWLTCDISGSLIGTLPYKRFGNNGLYVIPRQGPQAGKVIQVASAPNDAELTGPCFSPDYKTLFLSVQHPGERSRKGSAYTSDWPNGNGSKPLSSVVTVTGPNLEALTLGAL